MQKRWLNGPKAKAEPQDESQPPPQPASDSPSPADCPLAAPAADDQQQQQQQQQQRVGRLPVTLLSGFLGAGKTTLVRHLLSHAGPLRIAVLVNDVAALNIDAGLIKAGGLIQSQEQLVELQNGCICCSLRIDLVAAVAQLAAKGAFDLLLLESTGVSEPLQVAELFDVDFPIADILASSSSSEPTAAAAAAAGAVAAAAGGGDSAAAAAVLLRDVAYLDTAVTVVDAHQMLANLHSIHTFRDLTPDNSGSSSGPSLPSAGSAAAVAAAGGAAAESSLAGSHRHIAELLLEQVEVADVLLLNKADTVTPQELALLQAMLRSLNPSARLLTTTNSVVGPSEVLLTGLWEQHKAQGGAAWVQLMRQQGEGPLPQQQQQQQQGQAEAGCSSHSCASHAPHDTPHHHSCSSTTGTADAAAAGSSHSCTHSSCPCCPPAGADPTTTTAAAAAVAAAGTSSSTGGLVGGGAATRPTSDYGVSHFVYRARLPFHPVRLHDFMVKFFILQQPDWSHLLMGSEGEGGDSNASSSTSGSKIVEAPAAAPPAAAAAAAGGGGGSVSTVAALQAAASTRRAALEGSFGLLLRSKGFVWLATRGEHIGEWSQAGSLLSFSTAGPWFAVLPPSCWPEGEAERAAITADFAPCVGDRRQELVFIGVGLQQQALRAALDACLVTVGDMEAGFRGLPDPFEPWPSIENMLDLGEPSEQEEEEQEQPASQQQQQQTGRCLPGALSPPQDSAAAGATAAAAGADGGASLWQPGRVSVVTEGAAGLQELLNSIDDTLSSSSSSSSSRTDPAAAAAPRAVVVHWVAPWAAASLDASQQLAAVAAAARYIPVITLDVTVSNPNKALALEKVMEVPQAYRKGGRKFLPVPKSGEKWPCMTLHVAPSLQPQQEFSGPSAPPSLLAALQHLGCLNQQQAAAAAAAAAAATAAANAPAAAAATAAAAAAAAAAGFRAPYNQPHYQRDEEEHVGAEQEQEDEATPAAASPPPAAAAAAAGPQKGKQVPPFKLLKRGAADLKQLLQSVAPSQLLLLAWSPAQQPTAAAAAAAAAAATAASAATQASSSSTCVDSADGVEALAGALAAAAAAAGMSGGVVVAVADAAASAANQALAAALSVQQAAVVQLFRNRQVVKAVRVGGLEVAVAVGRVQKAVLQVLQQQQQQQAVKVQQQQQQQLPTISEAAAAPTAAAGATGNSSSSTTTTTAAGSSSSSSGGSLWDPPQGTPGKPAKPGSKHKFPASAVFGATTASSSSKAGAAATATVNVVFWPRMPCLNCGCPWWLGEDWDATCARCGWSCEEDGYDDDSNPLPQYAQRYKEIVGELKAGRTPSGLAPLE